TRSTSPKIPMEATLCARARRWQDWPPPRNEREHFRLMLDASTHLSAQEKRPGKRPAWCKSTASEIEADVEVQEPRRGVLRARASKIARRDVEVRVVKLHVVEQIHRLEPESHLQAFGEDDALADGRVKVPPREAADKAVAGPLVREEQAAELLVSGG